MDHDQARPDPRPVLQLPSAGLRARDRLAFGKGLPSALTIPGILIVLAASLVIQRGEVFAGRSADGARS